VQNDKRWWQAHVWLLGAYLGLAVVLTWPTALHLTTHLPGDGGDDPAIAWNLWWIKHSLLTLRQNPFQVDYLFHPIGINLAFYTLTFLNGLSALPLLLNIGVVTASNIHLFFTFVVSGYGAFMLTRYVLAGSPWGFKANSRTVWATAAVSGCVYAFASSKLFYVALGQFNIASAHWVPFSILYIIKIRHNSDYLSGTTGWFGKIRPAWLAALFLVMQAWTELTYASFIIVFLALYTVYWLYVDLIMALTIAGPRALWRRLSRHPFLWQLVAMGGLTLVGLAPILARMWPDLRAEGDFLVVGSGFAETFSADLLGFFVPTMHHPWLGGLIQQTGVTAYDKGQHIYLGYTLLGLAGLGFWFYRHDAVVRFWLFAAAIFAFLVLGPRVVVNGFDTGLGGPFPILQGLPFFKGNRYPARYSVLLVLSLAVLAALGTIRLAEVAARWSGGKQMMIARQRFWPQQALIIVTGALFILEHLSVPLPLSDLTVPEPYQIIAQDQDDFAVLDIPFAWRNGFRITGAWTTSFMYGQFYQTLHQKRLLQGNTSRNPEFKFQYFTEAPVLRSLLALETGHDVPRVRWAADRAIAPAVLNFFDIKYIVVRPEPAGYLDTPQATLPYIDQVLPVTKIFETAEFSLYQVENGSVPDRVNISPQETLAPLYLGEGWGRIVPGQPLVAQRARVRLLVPLNNQAQKVSLQARIPAKGSTTRPRRMWLATNGWQSQPVALGADWQTYTFVIPAGVTRAGLNQVWLRFDGLDLLTELNPPALTVISAGEETGDFGHIYLNGREVSPNLRGYNVALVSLAGELLAALNFDTHQDEAASRTMAQFLATIPDGVYVALAASDEASAGLGQEAVQAVQALGATGDLRGCFRCSHAFIRTPDGRTWEAQQPYLPASVASLWGLTEPAAAALVDHVVFEAVEEQE
jgi:hypothetical protein